MQLGSYWDLDRERHKSAPASPLEWDESFLESADLKHFPFEVLPSKRMGCWDLGSWGGGILFGWDLASDPFFAAGSWSP